MTTHEVHGALIAELVRSESVAEEANPLTQVASISQPTGMLWGKQMSLSGLLNSSAGPQEQVVYTVVAAEMGADFIVGDKNRIMAQLQRDLRAIGCPKLPRRRKQTSGYMSIASGPWTAHQTSSWASPSSSPKGVPLALPMGWRSTYGRPIRQLLWSTPGGGPLRGSTVSRSRKSSSSATAPGRGDVTTKTRHIILLWFSLGRF